MLDNGIPLIGELVGVLNSHAEVICGYDNALKIYYVRDPMHWSLLVLPFQELEKCYAMSGHSLIALVSPSKQKSVGIKPEWLSPTGQSLIQLQAACAQGKIAEAGRIHCCPVQSAKWSCAGFRGGWGWRPPTPRSSGKSN
jgi:hypothetical protein